MCSAANVFSADVPVFSDTLSAIEKLKCFCVDERVKLFPFDVLTAHFKKPQGNSANASVYNTVLGSVDIEVANVLARLKVLSQFTGRRSRLK